MQTNGCFWPIFVEKLFGQNFCVQLMKWNCATAGLSHVGHKPVSKNSNWRNSIPQAGGGDRSNLQSAEFFNSVGAKRK
jgi:hypothetical protein